MDNVINEINPIGTILSTLATREQRDLARTLLTVKPNESIQVPDLGGVISKILLDQDVDGTNALCIRYTLVHWLIVTRAIDLPTVVHAYALAKAIDKANDNLYTWSVEYSKNITMACQVYLDGLR